MRLRPFMGISLAGYGLIILIGLVAHESLWIGALSLLIGLILLATGLPQIRIDRAWLVGALGGLIVTGTLAYNIATSSGLGLPEVALVAYGLALVTAAFHLHRNLGRFPVGVLVAWSFPVLLAPLALFAADAFLAGPLGPSTGDLAAPLIGHLLVTPMSVALALLGTPNQVVGNNLLLDVSGGTFALGVGLVCAGFYPMILFGGVLGLHAWNTEMPRGRFLGYLATGIIGLWVVNIIRLVILGMVAARWGGQAVQTTHAHIGWVLFGLFMVLFWGLFVRRLEAHRSEAGGPPEPLDAA